MIEGAGETPRLKRSTMHEGQQRGRLAKNPAISAQRAIIIIGLIVLAAWVYVRVADDGRVETSASAPKNGVGANCAAPAKAEDKSAGEDNGTEGDTVHCDWSVPTSYAGRIIDARVRFFPKKLLALTFDDGPDPEVTPKILDTLKEYNAHATFFVLGSYAERHPDLVRRIVGEGHAIGNHSWSHAKKFSAAEAHNELHNTAAAIEKFGGLPTKLFRPPYGLTKSKYSELALQDGYTGVLWTISSADSRPISADVIAHNVAYTPNPGDIVLMHDGPGHSATADALPIILAKLEKDGFEFVPLPELLRAWHAWETTPG